MPTFRPELNDEDQKWIKQQQLFFVASAPLTSSGRVNMSPKGYDSFRILSPKKVAYLDISGSGIETITHLNENGRLTFMFCAFEGAPKILRLWCKGSVHPNGSKKYQTLLPELFPDFADQGGVRSIIVGDILEISLSCGFGVPLYEFKEKRQVLLNYWGKKKPEQITEYWAEKNATSIDGIPSQLSQSTKSWLQTKLHIWRDSVGPLSMGLIAGSVITVAVMKSGAVSK
ncbi:hypothetical protein INT43_002243 [Umbelopsis isabellina]|uniref:Pyridoxamine 5'-phosphate oxidase putative domain-containing protein n=1 Tax=Mortierella isabellina TaxID=91625 RepID=A0A8H7Q6U3_MORIS|nr:hypothetical protein INT43_002243 [Umbelopsis isabellina]